MLILVVSAALKRGGLLCIVEMPAKSDGGTVRTDHHENGGLASPLQRVRHGNHLDSVNRTIAVLASPHRCSKRVFLQVHASWCCQSIAPLTEGGTPAARAHETIRHGDIQWQLEIEPTCGKKTES